MVKLRALVKPQNDIINNLCTEADILEQTMSLTRSDRVKEGISKIVSSVEEFAQNRQPLQSALDDALKFAQQKVIITLHTGNLRQWLATSVPAKQIQNRYRNRTLITRTYKSC